MGSSQSSKVTAHDIDSEDSEDKPLVWTNFFNPINWIIWPVTFLVNFFFSRPYRLTGPAIFSVAICAIVAFLLAQQQYLGGKGYRVEQYQRMLDNATGRKDFKEALICNKTLIDLQPNELRFQLERARIEKELGNTELAYQIAYRLAIVRKYGLAALWLADEKFQFDKINEWSEDEHLKYRGLLLIATNQSSGTNKDLAKIRLAAYLSAIKADAEALKYLEDVVPNNPQFAFTAAELAFRTKDRIKLQTFLPIARGYYQERLKESPENLDFRLFLAQALVMDEEIDQAIQLLQDGMRLKVDQKYQAAMAEALAYKSTLLSKEKKTPQLTLQRLTLMLNASTLAPNNPFVVETLVQLLFEIKKDDNAEIASLREAATQGLPPEFVHFVRGTLALMDNQLEDAQRHLKLAADGGLQLPGILNNLAVAIAKSTDGDLNLALSLSNQALEKLPHPSIFETRGQILYRMGKYEECILDLEKGLQVEALVPEILPVLADAHRQLGNVKLAAEYEDQLKKLSKVSMETAKKEPSANSPP